MSKTDRLEGVREIHCECNNGYGCGRWVSMTYDEYERISLKYSTMNENFYILHRDCTDDRDYIFSEIVRVSADYIIAASLPLRATSALLIRLNCL